MNVTQKKIELVSRDGNMHFGLVLTRRDDFTGIDEYGIFQRDAQRDQRIERKKDGPGW